MRKILFTAVLLLTALMVNAKDIKTVVLTTDPIMHCANCEAKIKNNLKFCKGIKSIETSVENQTVTITYDADKTTPQAFITSLKKDNYTATEKSCAGKKECCKEKMTCKGREECGSDKCCAEKKCSKEKKESCEGNKSCCEKKADAVACEAKQNK